LRYTIEVNESCATRWVDIGHAVVDFFSSVGGIAATLVTLVSLATAIIAIRRRESEPEDKLTQAAGGNGAGKRKQKKPKGKKKPRTD
jgi:hypothetical protein